MVGSRDHRTQFWKGAIQGPFHQSLVQIGPVASEELIKMWKVNGRTDDAQWAKNNNLTLRSKVKVPRRSLRYATHRLMFMHPHTKYHWPISKDKNVTARTRKYYLKNNYLTLRSKVKVPWKSLQYAIHRLMVIHQHTKYHWPISKDKKIMVRTSFTEKKRKKKSD